jgi:hypothetical protein
MLQGKIVICVHLQKKEVFLQKIEGIVGAESVVHFKCIAPRNDEASPFA